MSNEAKWAWEGGDRFSIGVRMYVGAEVAELLDRYEQQDRMKTREINLIVPENKALEAKAKLADAYVHYRETRAWLDEHPGRYDAVASHDIAADDLDAAYDALSPSEAIPMRAICPACEVERADYEGRGKHLERCPNCGTDAAPEAI